MLTSSKHIAIAVAVTAALSGSMGFWVGKEWAEGRAAQRDVVTLRAEIVAAQSALTDYRTAIGDSATGLTRAATALKLSAITYAEERDHALDHFNRAAQNLETQLAARPDLRACRFGPDILRDINAARAGQSTAGAAGVVDPAAGARPGADSTLPARPAAVGR